MKVRFPLDENHQIDCQWNALTGLERYWLNGQEIHRIRSFAYTGERRLQVTVADRTVTVVIRMLFRPSLKTLWYNNGFVAEVWIDGYRLIADLLDRQYRVVPAIVRVLSSTLGMLALIVLLITVDAVWFEGTLLGLNVGSVPRSLRTINAALATPECRAALADDEASLLLSARRAQDVRRREMQRDINWIIQSDATVISTIMALYEDLPPPCQDSTLALLDRYLANGAAIDQRFGFRNMTVLESAIIAGQPQLACVLLERGASLQETVQTRRSDGTATPMTGMTLLELARYQASQWPTARHRQLLDSVRQFTATGTCPVRP